MTTVINNEEKYCYKLILFFFLQVELAVLVWMNKETPQVVWLVALILKIFKKIYFLCKMLAKVKFKTLLAKSVNRFSNFVKLFAKTFKVVLKVLNCGCGCIVIIIVISVVDAIMQIVVTAPVNFFKSHTKYSICIYNCYNFQIHIIYRIQHYY